MNTIIQIKTADMREYMVGEDRVVAITEVTPEVYDVRTNYGVVERVLRPVSVRAICEPDHTSVLLHAWVNHTEPGKGRMEWLRGMASADREKGVCMQLSLEEQARKDAILSVFPCAAIIRVAYYKWWGYIKFPEAEALYVGSSEDDLWQNFSIEITRKYGIHL